MHVQAAERSSAPALVTQSVSSTGSVRRQLQFESMDLEAEQRRPATAPPPGLRALLLEAAAAGGATPDTSLRASFESGLPLKSPLLEKLKDITRQSDELDEEEDKRQFFAEIESRAREEGRPPEWSSANNLASVLEGSGELSDSSGDLRAMLRSSALGGALRGKDVPRDDAGAGAVQSSLELTRATQLMAALRAQDELSRSQVARSLVASSSDSAASYVAEDIEVSANALSADMNPTSSPLNEGMLRGASLTESEPSDRSAGQSGSAERDSMGDLENRMDQLMTEMHDFHETSRSHQADRVRMRSEHSPSRLPVRSPSQFGADKSRIAHSSTHRNSERQATERQLTCQVDRLRAGLREALDDKDSALALAEKEAEACKAAELREQQGKERFGERIAQLLRDRANVDSGGEEGALLKERVLRGNGLDGVTKDELGNAERMIMEQETLLAGYQKENERLHARVKDAEGRARSRVSGGSADSLAGSENGEVVEDVAVLNRMLQTNRTAARRREAELQHSVEQARSALQALTVKFEGVDMLTVRRTEKELDLATLELEARKSDYETQLGDLNGQMTWYVENQELVTASDAKVSELERTVDELRTELGSNGGSKASNVSNRRRMHQLEAQVGQLKAELQEALMKKHPNSLPSLIRAARPPVEETAMHAFLETRVKQLEEANDSLEEDHAKSLRALRQNFERTKAQHEQRIGELKAEIAGKDSDLERAKNPKARIKALEAQLDDVRSFYTKKTRELTEKLRTKERRADSKLVQKVERLERELAKKTAQRKQRKQVSPDRRRKAAAAARSEPETSPQPRPEQEQTDAAESAAEPAAVAADEPPAAADDAAPVNSVQPSTPPRSAQASPASPAVTPPMEAHLHAALLTETRKSETLETDRRTMRTELDSLRVELRSHMTALVCKNEDLLTMQERLAAAQADAMSLRHLSATLQLQMDANERMPAFTKYRELEQKVGAIVRQFEGREGQLKAHISSIEAMSAQKCEELQLETTRRIAAKDCEIERYRGEVDSILQAVGEI